MSLVALAANGSGGTIDVTRATTEEAQWTDDKPNAPKISHSLAALSSTREAALYFFKYQFPTRKAAQTHKSIPCAVR